MIVQIQTLVGSLRLRKKRRWENIDDATNVFVDMKRKSQINNQEMERNHHEQQPENQNKQE